MRTRTTRTLLATSCLVLAPFSLGGIFDSRVSPASYYVATDGSDNNPGTLSEPWRHIDYAASNPDIKPGDTVFIRGGIYHESVQQGISGSPGLPITYRNYPGERPVISDTGAPDKWRWQALDQSYLRIQGITFSDYDGGAIQFRTVDLDIFGIEVIDCTFEHQHKYSGQAVHAVYFTSYVSGRFLQNIVVQGNRFYDIDTGTEPGESNEVLTAAGDVRNVRFVGNSISDVTNIGIDIIGRTTIGQPYNVLIRRNRVMRHGLAKLGGGAGIYLDGAGEYIIVEENVVIGDGDSVGISVNLESGPTTMDTRHVIVRRNLLYNNWRNLAIGAGGALEDCAQLGVLRDTVAVHNTVYSEVDGSKNAFFGCGESLRWRNNIYAHTGPTGYQYVQSNDTADPAAHSMDYNLFHSVGEKWWSWAGTMYITLVAFQAGSGQDPNSIEADPLFADVNSGNFHLRQGSPARDTGGPLTVASSSGSGSTIPVGDARYFSDGLGLQHGDMIVVGDHDPVLVIDVDYVSNLLTVDESISWENQAPVNYQYAGTGPDIGAFEEYPTDYATHLPLITRASSLAFTSYASPICGQEVLLISMWIVRVLVRDLSPPGDRPTRVECCIGEEHD